MSQFYGSSGVEVLYPSQMMNPHQFSEPEWSAPPLVRQSIMEVRRYTDKFVQVPMHPQDFDTKFIPPFSGAHRPPPIQVSHIPNNPVIPFARPKSSPSTFGPNVEDLLFTENPFRLKNEEYPTSMFSVSPQTVTTNKVPSPFYPSTEFPISNTSGSPIRGAPIAIAPDPLGLRQLNTHKRTREDDDQYSEYGQRKRKRATSNVGPVELNEEEQLLLKLKEEENLPWKDIAVRFQNDLGKSYQVPALQMRFKRLRERMRTWTETDVSHLSPSCSGLDADE